MGPPAAMARNAISPKTLPRPSDTWLLNWGRFALSSAFGLGLLITVYLTVLAPGLLPFLPLVMFGGVAAWVLFQYPLWNLFFVLALFAPTADFDDGRQIEEILYALYLVSYIVVWHVRYRLLAGRPWTACRADQLLLGFFIWMGITLPLTVVFGGSLGAQFSELYAWFSFLLYWPIKHAVATRPNGLRTVLLGVLAIGIFVFVRNVLTYVEILSSATQAWQVIKGRAVMNESLLMVPAFIALVGFIYSDSWRYRLLSGIGFGLFFTGLILTQSRGYWAAFLIANMVLFFVIPWRYKKKIVVSGGMAGIIAAVIGLLFFGDVIVLIAAGLWERLSSMGMAATRDISLINRFLESGAVWERIQTNPILGHGMGVPFRFFDITWEYSMNRAFIHNGYISIWYKFGLPGILLFLGFLGNTVWRAFRLVLCDLPENMSLNRVALLAALGSLLAFVVSTNTSNAFIMSDTILMLAALTGMVHGTDHALKVA